MEKTAVVQVLNKKAVLTSLIFNFLLTYRDTSCGRLFEIEADDIPKIKDFAEQFDIDLAIKERQEDGAIKIWASMTDFRGCKLFETFREHNGELVSSSRHTKRQYELAFIYKTKFI